MESTRNIASSIWKALLPAGYVFGAMAAGAAQPAPTPTITSLTEVKYEQIGSPLSGPNAVVIEHDPSLATHTI